MAENDSIPRQTVTKPGARSIPSAQEMRELRRIGLAAIEEVGEILGVTRTVVAALDPDQRARLRGLVLRIEALAEVIETALAAPEERNDSDGRSNAELRDVVDGIVARTRTAGAAHARAVRVLEGDACAA